MNSSERDKTTVNLFTTTVTVVGLIVFVYSAFTLAFQTITFEWVLLGLVSLLFVARIDPGITKTGRAISLSETFVFVAALLYGTHAAVVLAGLEIASRAIGSKERRATFLFN